MSEPNDLLFQKISEAMTEIIAGVDRVRARRASLAIQAAPLSVRAAKASTRKKRRDEMFGAARYQAPLTPRARLAMRGKVPLTLLDEMVTDLQAAALERWAFFEQVLEGRAKGVNFEASGGGAVGLPSPIADRLLHEIGEHVVFRRRLLHTRELAILRAFTALQNGYEGALSPAQYGLRIFPDARNKRDAFLRGVVDVAEILVKAGY
jgi:hypothetical protein